MKFRDPHGVIIDCTHLGWGGQEGLVPAEDAERENLEQRQPKATATEAAE